MKVICIENKYETNGEIHTFNITIGKMYESSYEYNYFFEIINDSGNRLFLSKGYVIPLKEYRQNQIDKIIKQT